MSRDDGEYSDDHEDEGRHGRLSACTAVILHHACVCRCVRQLLRVCRCRGVAVDRTGEEHTYSSDGAFHSDHSRSEAAPSSAAATSAASSAAPTSQPVPASQPVAAPSSQPRGGVAVAASVSTAPTTSSLLGECGSSLPVAAPSRPPRGCASFCWTRWHVFLWAWAEEESPLTCAVVCGRAASSELRAHVQHHSGTPYVAVSGGGTSATGVTAVAVSAGGVVSTVPVQQQPLPRGTATGTSSGHRSTHGVDVMAYNDVLLPANGGVILTPTPAPPSIRNVEALAVRAAAGLGTGRWARVLSLLVSLSRCLLRLSHRAMVRTATHYPHEATVAVVLISSEGSCNPRTADVVDYGARGAAEAPLGPGTTSSAVTACAIAAQSPACLAAMVAESTAATTRSWRSC